MFLRCGIQTLDLSMPVVMGIVNVTPDSFSDGGRWFDPGRAVDHAAQLIDEGAGIIDVGGESTRPGALPVSVEEEIRRVVPVVAALSRRVNVPISVDTSRAQVIRAAIDAGATLVNDIRALCEADALEAVAASNVGVCLMHMQGEPKTMQAAPIYADVVSEVRRFLGDRVATCVRAGIAEDRIAVDPGIGFGKTVDHNLQLLAGLSGLLKLNAPVLVGVSRKSVIGAVTGRPVEERMAGGVAFATAAVLAGASIIRAHDVAPTVDAVKVAAALRAAGTCALS